MKDSNRAMLSAGGCATGLLVTDRTAPPIRTTEDVEVIIQVASYHEYQEILRQELLPLGFAEDTRQGAPVCRWVIDGMTLDFMPTDPGILGFSNRCYEPAIQTAVWRRIGRNREIRLITAPYFLATKLTAFESRGKGDYWGSRDMEDVVTVVDGRPRLLKGVRAAEDALRNFLAEALSARLKRPRVSPRDAGYLPPRFGEPGAHWHDPLQDSGTDRRGTRRHK